MPILVGFILGLPLLHALQVYVMFRHGSKHIWTTRGTPEAKKGLKGAHGYRSRSAMVALGPLSCSLE